MNEKVSSEWVQRAMKQGTLTGKAVSSPSVLLRLHGGVSPTTCNADTAADETILVGSAAGEHRLAGARRVPPARIA